MHHGDWSHNSKAHCSWPAACPNVWWPSSSMVHIRGDMCTNYLHLAYRTSSWQELEFYQDAQLNTCIWRHRTQRPIEKYGYANRRTWTCTDPQGLCCDELPKWFNSSPGHGWVPISSECHPRLDWYALYILNIICYWFKYSWHQLDTKASACLAPPNSSSPAWPSIGNGKQHSSRSSQLQSSLQTLE